MESTLHALGGLILKALPTLLLVALLHLYLKFVFFKPLKRVLDARYAATEGAKKMAEESLATVTARTAEYEEALRVARAEVYQAQDQMHRQLEEERAREVQAVRAQADADIRRAKEELASDAEQARKSLALESERLADLIARTILDRRAA